MKHLGLFEGIGGFSLAARWAGWETVAWCEINPFCQRVLKYHFPQACGHADIKTTDFTKYRNAVDIVTGGFPCQPYSTAGKRKGKEDDRHLWPEMLRAIREISPRWVVGENVRGLTNWNGGLVFDEVQADLEAEGFEILPFLLPACAVNAPHRRDRVWFVAYASNNVQQGRLDFRGNKGEAEGGEGQNQQQGLGKENGERIRVKSGASSQAASDTSSARLSLPFCRQLRGIQETAGTQPGSKSERVFTEGGQWDRFPTQPALCSGDDGVSYQLDGIAFRDWYNESIKAYGNAVVPPLVLEIFKAINQYEANRVA